MPVGQMAERLGDVNASLRGTQRHVCEQLDETVIGIVQLDPNAPTCRRRSEFDGTAETMGKVVDETQHQIVLADERHGYGHKPTKSTAFILLIRALVRNSSRLSHPPL